jgi:hypothetical protein
MGPASLIYDRRTSIVILTRPSLFTIFGGYFTDTNTNEILHAVTRSNMYILPSDEAEKCRFVLFFSAHSRGSVIEGFHCSIES